MIQFIDFYFYCFLLSYMESEWLIKSAFSKHFLTFEFCLNLNSVFTFEKFFLKGPNPFVLKCQVSAFGIPLLPVHFPLYLLTQFK